MVSASWWGSAPRSSCRCWVHTPRAGVSAHSPPPSTWWRCNSCPRSPSGKYHYKYIRVIETTHSQMLSTYKCWVRIWACFTTVFNSWAHSVICTESAVAYYLRTLQYPLLDQMLVFFRWVIHERAVQCAESFICAVSIRLPVNLTTAQLKSQHSIESWFIYPKR